MRSHMIVSAFSALLCQKQMLCKLLLRICAYCIIIYLIPYNLAEENPQLALIGFGVIAAADEQRFQSIFVYLLLRSPDQLHP